MKSIKIRLELNNKQKTLALQHCGTARYAYNWALSYCKKIDEFNKTAKKEDKQKYPSAIDFHKMFVKDVKSVNKWLYDVSKWTAQEPLRNLQKAYSRYFSELKQGAKSAGMKPENIFLIPSPLAQYEKIKLLAKKDDLVFLEGRASTYLIEKLCEK